MMAVLRAPSSLCKLGRTPFLTMMVLMCCVPTTGGFFLRNDRARERMVKGPQLTDIFQRYERQRNERQYEQQYEQQHEQQYEQQYEQPQKRQVPIERCWEPSELKSTFLKINSQLNSTQFLHLILDERYANSIPIRVGGGPPPPPPPQQQRRAQFKRSSLSDEERACPRELSEAPRAPLAERQLCPYYYDHVELPQGYFPPVLKRAVCKCDACIHNEAYRCQPVKASVSVLKPAGCILGLQRYEQEEYDDVPISCACAV